jgi:hypothetical protein
MCRRGFSDMQTVMKDIKDERLRAYFVWLPCIWTDDRDSAVERSKEFADPRLRQFWDGKRYTGIAWDKTLDTGELAWDVYLIYRAGTKWQNDAPPIPNFWMHQLGGIEHAPRLDRTAFESKVREFLNRK